MVFSVETINESRNMNMTSSIIDNIDEGYMKFEDTLTRLLDESIEFDAMLAQYIGEGLNLSIDKNGINVKAGINPMDILSRILEKFIQFIEDLAGNFRAFLAALLSKNARLTVYKSKLANFRQPIHYNRYYYEYSHLDLDTSSASYGSILEKEYKDLLNGLDKCRSCNDNTSLSIALSELYEDSQYVEEDFDDLRGKVLGLGRPVVQTEFREEIFKYFRSGKDTPIDPNAKRNELNLDAKRVHEACVEYYNNNRHISIVERDKQKLKHETARQKSLISSTDLKDFTGVGITTTAEMKNMYHSIISNRCRRVKAICDIYTILFDGKIDAYKEYNVTNKNICLEAIKVIAKEK